jgi:hypothetical protein
VKHPLRLSRASFEVLLLSAKELRARPLRSGKLRSAGKRGALGNSEPRRDGCIDPRAFEVPYPGRSYVDENEEATLDLESVPR